MAMSSRRNCNGRSGKLTSPLHRGQLGIPIGSPLISLLEVAFQPISHELLQTNKTASSSISRCVYVSRQIGQLQTASWSDWVIFVAKVSIELVSITFDLYAELDDFWIFDDAEETGGNTTGSRQLVENDIVLIT
jgi:hypothetical protein